MPVSGNTMSLFIIVGYKEIDNEPSLYWHWRCCIVIVMLSGRLVTR